MSKTQDKQPLEISETEEDLKSVAKEAGRALKVAFENFKDELENFDKNHEEKRKKLFNGNRRRTSGRIV